VFFNIALIIGYTTADWAQISQSIQRQRLEDERQRGEIGEGAGAIKGGNNRQQEQAEQSIGLVPISSGL
jgi:hypothetical protein